jgi:hypothetical protein
MPSGTGTEDHTDREGPVLARIRKAQEENEAASPSSSSWSSSSSAFLPRSRSVFLNQRKKAVDTSMIGPVRSRTRKRRTSPTTGPTSAWLQRRTRSRSGPRRCNCPTAARRRSREHGRFGLLRADEPPGRQAAVHAELVYISNQGGLQAAGVTVARQPAPSIHLHQPGSLVLRSRRPSPGFRQG